MPHKTSNLIILFLLLSVAGFGQRDTIYCIKSSYFHSPDIHDSSATPFLRTLWFDICTENFSVSKSWQYNSNGETELQMVSYTNQLNQQKMDLTWEKETETKKEHYNFQLTSYDSTTSSYFSFNADVHLHQISRIYLEKWQVNNDKVITEIYQINNDTALIVELQNWMIKDRYSKDSLSIPIFLNLLAFQKKLINDKIETIKPKYIVDFSPTANSFACGDTKIPSYIKESSKLLGRKEKGLYEKRYQKKDDIETYYEIFFKQK